tara:strand:- start:68 stop:592 length:525 start_codon:yes stop_codon:yes gene_type:complete
VDKLPSDEIIKHLIQMEERPWPEIADGRPITPTRLASMVKELNIKPYPGVFDGYPHGKRGYRKSDFDNAFKRYLKNLPASPQVSPSVDITSNFHNDEPTTLDKEVCNLHPCDLLRSSNDHDLAMLSNLYDISSSIVLSRMSTNEHSRFDNGLMSKDELEDIIFKFSERLAIQNE